MAEAIVERLLPGAPERIWHALTDARELEEWFWPRSFALRAEYTPRAGTVWRFTAAATGLDVGGVVTAVDEIVRVEQTWRWDGDEHESVVTLQLVRPDGDGGTLLRVRHAGLRDDAEATSHREGWESCLDRLPAHLHRPIGATD